MQSYFLGANTKNGFSSLYAGFPPRQRDYLRIVKGGPGTGKSTLLKAIAKAAEDRGLGVERILCSGDPDSLDGLYLPTLCLALADGTAPHVMEPGLFGVTGDYLDLGRHFTEPFSEAEKQTLLTLQQDYREDYRLAYEKLNQAASLGWNRPLPVEDPAAEAVVRALPRRGNAGSLRRVFRSAITCRGILHAPLSDALQIIPAAPEEIRHAAGELFQRGWDLTLCPSPLDPEQPELLLVEEAKLALLASTEQGDASREQMQQAVELLARAKAKHDEMEKLYRPHIDLAALTREAERQIAANFSQ